VSIAVAIAASSGYTTKREVELARGESATVRGFTVTYLGPDLERSDQKTTVKARVAVSRGGDSLGTYAPSISSYPGFGTGIGTPSVRTGLVRDLYLTLISSPTADARVTLGVQVNPMVLWLWIGGLLMALGTAVALLPAKRTPVLDRARDEPATADSDLVEVTT
jgi:cytochrome c-type biogenesis protein CcmF